MYEETMSRYMQVIKRHCGLFTALSDHLLWGKRATTSLMTQKQPYGDTDLVS